MWFNSLSIVLFFLNNEIYILFCGTSFFILFWIELVKYFCSLHLFFEITKIYITKEIKILQNEIIDKQCEVILFIKNNSICLANGD